MHMSLSFLGISPEPPLAALYIHVGKSWYHSIGYCLWYSQEPKSCQARHSSPQSFPELMVLERVNERIDAHVQKGQANAEGEEVQVSS